MATNPYQSLPKKNFWASAVAQRNFFDIRELWEPKFEIVRSHKIATFGSCFAQHLGTALREAKFGWMDAEPAPASLSKKNRLAYNYGVFSCRTGNIYTATLLRQWTDWAFGAEQPNEFWAEGNRIFDPFRPRIEPDGFQSEDEMRVSRELAVEAFRDILLSVDIFVFTLGLTESWFHSCGYEYPMCPGTAAGQFNEGCHTFLNQSYELILSEISNVVTTIRRKNPHVKFLFTVSPIPLTATASNKHVLVATMESKSILRAVAGQLAASDDQIDYFPSYEIINSPLSRGVFFDPNQRTVNKVGVDHVMRNFFECLEWKFPQAELPAAPKEKMAGNIACEEELLGAFAR